MSDKKSNRLRLGDVYAIPLPNGKYAYARAFLDSAISVYKHIGNSREDVPKSEDYQFTVGVYEYVLKSEEWQVVDHRPFKNDEEKWPPPTCVIDRISGKFSIYHKGEFRHATKTECEGLEIAAVWGAEHIIDRIMGNNKWTPNF